MYPLCLLGNRIPNLSDIMATKVVPPTKTRTQYLWSTSQDAYLPMTETAPHLFYVHLIRMFSPKNSFKAIFGRFENIVC